MALELAQSGVRSIVFERRPRMHNVPKGQNLTQRTAEHFLHWGIERALRAAVTVPPEVGGGGMTAYGSLLRGLHYDWLKRESVARYYASANARLPQYAMENVLRAEAALRPEIELRLGWRVTGVEQGPEGVTVEAEDGATGTAHRIAGAYAVGCDGAHSLLRDAAGITQTVSDHHKKMALLVFRSEEMERVMDAYPGKAFMNVLTPELDGYWQFFGRVDMGGGETPPSWFFHAPVDPEKDYAPEDFAPLVARAIGRPIALDVIYSGFWNLRFAVADSYRAGRLFIAGDACHSHPPYGGYGVNNGLEDARNLGWKLAARINGWGSEALLDSYSAERQPVFASVARDFIEASIDNDRAFLRSRSPEQDADEFARSWQGRAAFAASEVDRYEPHYSGSPIVLGGAGETSAIGGHSQVARAGHHLVPVTVAMGGLVQERLSGGYALLTPPGADQAADFTRAAEALSVPCAVLEAEVGEMERLAAQAVLVRPDGFVAWAQALGAEAPPAAAILRHCVSVGEE
ncbi:FAD-dependent oxidoreductase [Sinisalibacter aestuarii]|uniref:FAD-dependent oxidoreductase n=1 Tax=Sinisalibacter aestuarii TaxID=2949426 RepID=A0ABQ5LYC3_9RHOB|nr:FAD-dependent oxidoreductase [Sinisalibacter aestuarii]